MTISEKAAYLKGLMDGLELDTEKAEGKIIPKWVEVDKENGKGKIIAMPQREDIDFEIDEQLIVELYSK